MSVASVLAPPYLTRGRLTCGPTTSMSPDDPTWLLFATPAAVAALGAFAYSVTARQMACRGVGTYRGPDPGECP